MHTNNIAGNTNLTTTNKAYNARTQYNAANWAALTAALAKGQTTAAQLAAAILAAVPNQQPHHPMQFVKYQVRGGYLAPAKAASSPTTKK